MFPIVLITCIHTSKFNGVNPIQETICLVVLSHGGILDRLHFQVSDMSRAVHYLLDFLELLIEAQFLVDLFLVMAYEHGGAQDGIQNDDDAWEGSHHAEASLEEGENTNDCKAEADEVGLCHVHGNACLQQELNKSHNVEGQEHVAEDMAGVSANKAQVNLANDHAYGNYL